MPGRIGHAGNSPLGQGRRKRLLHRLFGHVKIIDLADHGGDDTTPVGAIDRINDGIRVSWHNSC